MLEKTGDIRVSLYKALLFAKIAEALKGGVLNLLPKDDWQAHRDDTIYNGRI